MLHILEILRNPLSDNMQIGFSFLSTSWETAVHTREWNTVQISFWKAYLFKLFSWLNNLSYSASFFSFFAIKVRKQ